MIRVGIVLGVWCLLLWVGGLSLEFELGCFSFNFDMAV